MWPPRASLQKTVNESSSGSGEIFTIEPMSELPLMRDRMKPSSGEKLIAVRSLREVSSNGTAASLDSGFRYPGADLDFYFGDPFPLTGIVRFET